MAFKTRSGDYNLVVFVVDLRFYCEPTGTWFDTNGRSYERAANKNYPEKYPELKADYSFLNRLCQWRAWIQLKTSIKESNSGNIYLTLLRTDA